MGSGFVFLAALPKAPFLFTKTKMNCRKGAKAHTEREADLPK